MKWEKENKSEHLLAICNSDYSKHAQQCLSSPLIRTKMEFWLTFLPNAESMCVRGMKNWVSLPSVFYVDTGLNHSTEPERNFMCWKQKEEEKCLTDEIECQNIWTKRVAEY